MLNVQCLYLKPLVCDYLYYEGNVHLNFCCLLVADLLVQCMFCIEDMLCLGLMRRVCQPPSVKIAEVVIRKTSQA
jgi:hypothetical protein